MVVKSDGVGDASQELVYIFKFFVTAIILLYTAYVSITGYHYYEHALERHIQDIDANREFVRIICSNETLVRNTRQYESCERCFASLKRDPYKEALYDTFESFHWCASSTDPHHIDVDGHGGRSSEMHCAHAYYVLGGIVVSLLFVLPFVCVCCR